MDYRDIKINIAQVAISQISTLQGIAVDKVEEVVNRVLNELSDDCPSLQILENLSKVVNNVRPVLSSADRVVSSFSKVSSKLESPLQVAKVVVGLLSQLPIPTTIGTPPGPAGGVVYSMTAGQLNSSGAKVKQFSNLIESLENNIKAINTITSDASAVFDPIKRNLDMIDELINNCIALQTTGEGENPIKLRQDLSAQRKAYLDGIRGQLPEEEQYTAKNGQTYTLKVITLLDSPKVAPARRAVVLNRNKVEVLKGPKSFASSNRVLIQEIKFLLERQLS